MKILFILRTPIIGGVEQVVFKLAEEMTLKGHNAEILFLYQPHVNSEVFKTNIKHHQNTGSLLFNFFNNIKLIKKFDLVHNHTFGLSAIYVWIVSLISSSPLLTTLHSSFNLTPIPLYHNFKAGNRLFLLYKYLDRGFNFLGKKVVVVAPYIKTIMANSINIREQKLEVICNAVSKPKSTPPEITNRNKNIIFLGRLSEEKNVDLIIKAWAEAKSKLNDNTWRLLIYGDGNQRTYLEQLAGELNVSEQTFFMGYTHNIYDVLIHSQIAISASEYEGLPLSVLEYLNANVCCIASDIEAHQFLEINKWGVLVEPKDVLGYRDAIVKLVNDEELRQQLSHESQKLMGNFSVDTFVTKHELLYLSLVKT
jgi:glycosyltransferase involved in cell wall biosynthesis